MSERLYSLLLQLYPRAFRERYATEMARVFRDRLRDEPAARVWIDVLADAAVSLPHQHLEPVPDAMYPPSASPMRLSAARSLVSGRALGAVVIAGLVAGILARSAGGWLLGWLLLVLLMFVPSVMGVSAVRRSVRVCRAIRSVWADVTEESVTVGYAGAPALTLQRRDVTGVHDFELIGLRIQTADPAHDLWVPARTEAYADARVRLAHWAPMTVTPFFNPVAHPTRHFIPPGWAKAVGVLSTLLVTGMGLLVALPLPLKGFVAGSLTLSAVAGLINRDQPAWEKLLPLGALTLLLLKWLW
jgi:hypothetical protein